MIIIGGILSGNLMRIDKAKHCTAKENLNYFFFLQPDTRLCVAKLSGPYSALYETEA